MRMPNTGSMNKGVMPPLQQGAALLLLLAILTVSIASFILTGTSRVQHVIDAHYKNSTVLSRAKSALISYSRLSDPDLTLATGLKLRYLPCPDLDGDGIEETPCGTTSVEGWLPWQSLGIAPLRDASGSCLRYFISASYKQGSSVVPSIIPALPAGDFTLRNTNNIISTNVVAILVAPNSIVGAQTRDLGAGATTECGSSITGSQKNQAANYMDSHNGVNNAVAPIFITAPRQIDTTVNFNDSLLSIMASEL